jgi:hypothetical protein
MTEQSRYRHTCRFCGLVAPTIRERHAHEASSHAEEAAARRNPRGPGVVATAALRIIADRTRTVVSGAAVAEIASAVGRDRKTAWNAVQSLVARGWVADDGMGGYRATAEGYAAAANAAERTR